MSLRLGTQLGSLEIAELLGVGGMGEVYRARDTKLKREVAIKILPVKLSRDPDRISRFQREAEFLASLNHPNIAAIYDLREADDIRFLVMELVEGPTLADRLERGPIPVAEALAIAQQIVNALDAAHERGIIHRDLKPANIKVTADGLVKVLDFGLAKGAREESEGPGISQLPTSVGTEPGIILGTPAYMSPEQARGQAVDKRTDIWAFGCVLYEMLTGRAVFRGGTATDMLAAVLEREPDWAALPATTPAGVRRLLERCLVKDPKQRLRDIGDAAADLDGKSPRQLTAAPGSSLRGKVALSIATILIVVLSIALWSLWNSRKQPHTDQAIMQMTIVLPSNQNLATGSGVSPLAISRDGARVAYVAQEGGNTQLYVRELDAIEPKPLPGTAGAGYPFFSPDGQRIGFFAGDALQIVSIAGGAPLRLCPATGQIRGASWGPDNTIVWGTNGSDLMKISVGGGVPKPLSGSKPAIWPELLPDGKTVLFSTGGAIAAISLDGGPRRIVARTDSRSEKPALLGQASGIAQVHYVADGSYLVYGQSLNPGSVRAIEFDPVSLTAKGSVFSLADSVDRAPAGGGVYFAVSESGLLLYVSTGDHHQLVWVERNGTVTPVSDDRRSFRFPTLSRKSNRIAVGINDEIREPDIYIYDAGSGKGRRATKKSYKLSPVWEPDDRLTFGGPSGDVRSASTDAAGTESPEILLSRMEIDSKMPASVFPYPTSWLSDGRSRTLLLQSSIGLWLLTQDGNSGPRSFIQTPIKGLDGQFSPDGQWVAYASSEESGRSEIYVRHYPDFGSATRISTDGGAIPRWSRRGDRIFYLQGDAVMEASVQPKPVFHADKPLLLFKGRFRGAGQDLSFDVDDDGRFLMVQSDPAANLQQITVVQNRFAELKRQAPVRK